MKAIPKRVAFIFFLLKILYSRNGCLPYNQNKHYGFVGSDSQPDCLEAGHPFPFRYGRIFNP